MSLKKYILTFMAVVFFLSVSNARISWHSKKISFDFGQTYRMNNFRYDSFDLTYESTYHNCLSGNFYGIGLRLNYFEKNNFEIGPRYYDTFFKRTTSLINPYWSISPVYFLINESSGLNIKPEVGLMLNTSHHSALSINIKTSYGYNIPIISESSYSYGRHDVTVQIGLAINVERLFNKKEKDGNLIE